MLFHIEHIHTTKMCPADNPEMAKKTFGKIAMPEHANETGVKLLGSYADAPAHTTYFIVETDSIEKVGTFLLPLLKLGSAEITAVTDLVEELKRKMEEAKKM